MKKITLMLFFLTTNFIFSQVVLNENFESGTSIPAGWTNNDIAGGGDIWVINSGADAVGFTAGNGYYYSLGEMSSNYALFDSDGYGDNSIAENAALESPIFDCSSLTSVELTFNHFFTSGFGGQGFIEVSTNGTTWIEVANYTGADQNDSSFGFVSIDVSSQLAGNATSQVRFRWTGNWAWGWAIDDVSVFQCIVNVPDAVTSATSPSDGATDVAIDYTNNLVGPFGWTVPGTGDATNFFNLSLGTDMAGTNIGTIGNFPNGESIVYNDWQPSTTYYWYVESVNCAGSTQSSIFSFTTAACPEASAPDAITTATYPANNATNIEISYGSTDNSIGPFEWTVPSTGSPATIYNYSLGTNAAGDDIGAIEDVTSGDIFYYDWQPNTTYYWFIESINCAGTTQSSIFSFTTAACTETAISPSAPTPANTATNVSLTSPNNGLAFSWTAGNPNDNFDLHIATNIFFSDEFIAEDFESGESLIGLSENTTYYWYVTAINCSGTIDSPTWEFTTGTALSVEEKEIELFSIYPNPTNDVLNIKSNLKIKQIQILNLLGQNVLSLGEENLKSSTIDVSEFKSGIYIMKVKSDTKEQSVRFIKE